MGIGVGVFAEHAYPGHRVNPDEAGEEGRRFAAKMTAAVVVFEDVPQLCINIVYLNTMGVANADPVGVFSFIMSILSLIFNAGLGISEAGAMAEVGGSVFG